MVGTEIIVFPGFSSDGKRYSERISSFENELGVRAVLPELSYWMRPVNIRESLEELLGKAEGAVSDGKFFLFASSFGAIPSAKILAGPKGANCRGAVFWNPSVAPKDSSFWKREGWALEGGTFFRKMRPGSGDSAIVSEVFFKEALEWDSSELARKIRCPFLVLQGRKDSVVSVPKTEEFFRKLASESKSLELLDSGHSWRDPSTGRKDEEIEKEAFRRTLEFFRSNNG